MSATNLLSSDKGQNFLPPPAIFLSEATSDGEDTGEDNVNNQGPRLVKCEAVLTDVEYSSDEDEVVRKYVSPAAVNCSSESQVVERVFQRNTQKSNDELTDTENLYASDDDLCVAISDDKGDEIEECEDGVTTISDQIKTNNKTRNRFGGNIPKNVEIKYPRNGSTCKRINNTNYPADKDYLAPVNKLGKKKKRKGKLLLESCLTDTEDVDVPSDVDGLNRVVKKDVSYTLFPSEKEELEYTNRIKHTSSLRGTEKYTLLEFLSNKLEEGGVTDTDEIAYSECEDVEITKDTEYELDFSNEVSNKESVIQATDRKPKKKRNTRLTPESGDTDDEEFNGNAKFSQRIKCAESPTNNLLAVGVPKNLGDREDVLYALTDTEDINYSDGECGSSRPKCPTPDIAFFEDSTILQNESIKIMQALEGISDADPLTDCEEMFVSLSPRRHKKNLGRPPAVCIEGLTDTEELLFSDGNLRNSDVSDNAGDSCSETDVEICSNIGEIDDLRCHAPSVTPDCLRNMDNTYISNIEGSEAYLKQIKGNKSRSFSGPSVISTVLPTPAQDTDSEEIQTEDETVEEVSYNRACTPSNYFEKFNLEDQSSVIHEKSTRSFQTDGAESLHIKDPSYQQDPVTDSEDIPLLD